ncbi:class I SAM-dependent methyltransferase [bacterium]|nr:class I SAM-dependent methyltransferase [bacterium]
MSGSDIVKRFFTGTGQSYDLIVDLFTYGADRYWKARMLKMLPRCHRILDLACGTGILTYRIAAKFPYAKIVGIDMMGEYIALAQEKKKRLQAGNIRFVCGKAEEVSLKEQFDCITSSYIPKYVSPDRLLENVYLNLDRGGIMVLHDFSYPSQFLARKAWELHMRLMKYLGTPIFPEWKIVFSELVDLVRATDWVSQYSEAFKRFGFTEIRVEQCTLGSSTILSGRRAS